MPNQAMQQTAGHDSFLGLQARRCPAAAELGRSAAEGFRMAEGRPAISAEIRRRVLVEAGHRCAIPTCRYIEVDIHHIIPWEDCQTHEYDNLIALCPNCHRRADHKEIDRKALRIYKASLRFTHDRFSQFEVDILFEAIKLDPGYALPFPPTMVLLVKRLLDAGYIVVQKDPRGSVALMGVQASSDLLGATDKGREYVNSLGLDRAW